MNDPPATPVSLPITLFLVLVGSTLGDLSAHGVVPRSYVNVAIGISILALASALHSLWMVTLGKRH